MTTTLTIAGPTFANVIQPRLPTIPNLRTLAFFGTEGEGNSGNRVAGGQPIVVQSGAPVYTANYVSLGLQNAQQAALNTQNNRDAATLASGVTWAAVVRGSQLAVGSAALASVFCDMNTGAIGQAWFVEISGNQKISLSPANIDRVTITMVNSIITGWHFIAMTYSGGGTGTFTIYDFTENPVTGVPITWATTGVTWQSTATTQWALHFGGTTTESRTLQPVEHAFALDAHTVLDAPTLAQVYGWTKANLARRNPPILC